MIFPENNVIGGCSKHPGQSFLDCYYCMIDSNKPKKKVKPKNPTGILKDLQELKRFDTYDHPYDGQSVLNTPDGDFVLWEDVEKIIKKYS